jgi:ribosomal protein L11 methyltransferase
MYSVGDAKWLEVSLTVDGELAEAVAEVLDRFASGGVVVESNVKYRNVEDEGTPYGPVKVFGFLTVDETLEEKRHKLEEALWYLNAIRELPQAVYREIADQNWMTAWKEHYRPIEIGKKLLILPAWIEQKDMTRVAVKIDPSMAFGTGTHPSTQLCLELIEEHVQSGKAVIDIGCGSGILTIAALKLGASQALAVDIDAESVKETLKACKFNQVGEQVETGQGSVEEIMRGDFGMKQAPLVLANILAPVLIKLFDDGMAETVTPRGAILLAGILAEQGAKVRAAAESKGLTFVEERHSGDWVALVMKK